MAYSPLPSKVSEDLLTLGNYTSIKGNFEASCPDIITTKGDLCVGTGPDAAARLAVGDNESILVADQFEATGMEWQIIPGARIYDTSNSDPATSSWVTQRFDSERTDADGMHQGASNRLVIPTGGGGLYLVGGCVEFDTSGKSAGSSIQGLRVILNASEVIVMELIKNIHASFDAALSIQTLYEFAEGDVLALQAYVSIDVDILATGNYSREFWAIWQRRSRLYL